MLVDRGDGLGKRRVRKSFVLAIMIVSILGVIVGMKYILPLFLPFVFGYFLAWLAAPIVTFLTVRFHAPRGICSFIVVILFLFVIGTGIFFLIRVAFLQFKTLVENLPMYEQMILERLSGACLWLEQKCGLENGTLSQKVMEQVNQMRRMFVEGDGLFGQDLSGQAVNVAASVISVVWNVMTMLIATLLILKDYGDYKESFRNSYFYKEIHMVTGVLSNMGIAYLKAQFIMMCIIAGICVVGLLLMGNRYALLVGIAIAIFDAFPVLGSAFILIPWCIIKLLQKKVMAAVILGVTYVFCQLTRQLLEPKLVGDRIGIQPVYTLISMYVGLKLYGAFGFILGPISLVAIKAIVSAAIGRLKGEEEKQSVDKTEPLA